MSRAKRQMRVRRAPLTSEAGEVRELTAEDFARARPAREVLPRKLYRDLADLNRRAGVRGPQKAPAKERITIRLSREVLERFRASGVRWQTRMDDVLLEWIAKPPRSSGGCR